MFRKCLSIGLVAAVSFAGISATSEACHHRRGRHAAHQNRCVEQQPIYIQSGYGSSGGYSSSGGYGSSGGAAYVNKQYNNPSMGYYSTNGYRTPSYAPGVYRGSNTVGGQGYVGGRRYNNELGDYDARAARANYGTNDGASVGR